MTRILSLRQAADSFAGIKPSYLRRIAADQIRLPHSSRCAMPCTDPDHRRYPASTHERFPLFTRDSNGRYVISQNALDSFLRRRIERLEPAA